MHGLTNLERTTIGLFRTDDHAKQSGFTSTVGTNHANNPTPWQRERQIVIQQLVAVRLAQILRNHNVVAQPRRHRNHDFIRTHLLGLRLALQLLKRLHTRLVLGLSRTRSQTHPIEFALQRSLTRGFRFFFLLQTIPLLLQPTRIIAFPRNALAAIQLENPLRDVVQEVTIVGDGHDSSRKFRQEPLKPCDRFGIQMVGWFVQQQHVRLLQQYATQRNPSPFATGERVYIRFTRR